MIILFDNVLKFCLIILVVVIKLSKIDESNFLVYILKNVSFDLLMKFRLIE